MDKLILGLLMVKPFTVYELRQVIGQNFSSMCSNSLGSIQAALKKLVGLEAVTFSEYVEKGKMKKDYAITDLGRDVFLEWLRIPMDMGKAKNMDLGKFLFMGFLPKKEQLELLDLAREGIRQELEQLQALRDSIAVMEEKAQLQAYLEQNSQLAAELQEINQTENLPKTIDQLAYFELKTLELGIDTARFQLDWFERLRQELSQES